MVVSSSGMEDLSSLVLWQRAEAIVLASSALNHLYLICPHLQMAQVPFQPYLDGDKLLLDGALVGRENFSRHPAPVDG